MYTRVKCKAPSLRIKENAVYVAVQSTTFRVRVSCHNVCYDIGEAYLPRAAAGLRGADHIVRVARRALLLKRRVNLPRRSCTSRTLAVHGTAVLRSLLLSTTVMYMPRLMTPSLSSMSLPGEPGVSKSSSSQMDSPSAIVEASSVSSSESVVSSCESLRHDDGAGDSEKERLRVRDSDSDGVRVRVPLSVSSWLDAGDCGERGEAYSARKSARNPENFSVT